VTAVHKNVLQTLGHGFSVVVAPGSLHEEETRETAQSGISDLDDEVFEMQEARLEALNGFW
jgi:hypothetical protein